MNKYFPDAHDFAFRAGQRQPVAPSTADQEGLTRERRHRLSVVIAGSFGSRGSPMNYYKIRFDLRGQRGARYR